jgi:LmbE family N-acetylglucosaminyl deacetylase
MRVALLILFFLASLSLSSYCQSYNSSTLKKELKALPVFGKVMYMAAHPDDENTRLISYLSNHELVETAYFSLTRGDGGQNLIGNEKGAALGILRTQELIEARKIDGGIQFFSNAVDFGYTRSEKETLTKWDEEKVLDDAIAILRTFKPDVIILRFPPDSRAGHGHHTASASIALKAAELAKDPSYVSKVNPELEAWHVECVYVNTGRWWVSNIDSIANAQPEKYLKVNVGAYDPILGKSYSEIAGLSRSEHKSQGFGAARAKGNLFEYLELVYGKGDSKSIFGSISTSPERAGMSKNFAQIAAKIYQEFDGEKPWNSINDLLKLRKLLDKATDIHWKKLKQNRIDALIKQCLGLVIEVGSPKEHWVPGTSNTLEFRIINRSPQEIEWKNIYGLGMNEKVNQVPEMNAWQTLEKEIDLPTDYPLSTPYWLNEPFENRFSSNEAIPIGMKDSIRSPSYTFTISIQGTELKYTCNTTFTRIDRVKGELTHPVFISPALSIHPENKVVIFRPGQTKTIRILLRNKTGPRTYTLETGISAPWKGPNRIEIAFDSSQTEQWVDFKLTAPKAENQTHVFPFASEGSRRFDQDQLIIDYDHISPQSYCPIASMKLVTIDLNTVGSHIAYVEGAGDEVPEALAQIGYQVTSLNPEDLAGDLSGYQAILFGVRAFNVHPELANYSRELSQFMENGGSVVIQYNTSRGLNLSLGPYPFKLTRDRITDEYAKVSFSNAKDPILNYPNKITTHDFDNWVQERGLYFVGEVDANYRMPIRFEYLDGTLDGSLITTAVGKGSFTYTSISLFRQLPAGVPGSYKLLANFIAGGKESTANVPPSSPIPDE